MRIRNLKKASSEITKREEIEQLLKENDEWYKSLFDNMLDGFAYCKMIFDEDGKPSDFIYLEVNNAFEKLTGLKREKVVGRKVTDAIRGIKENNPELFEIYGKVSETGNEERFEVFVETLKIWLSILAYSPKKGYFAAVFENITERKKNENALLESQQKFSALFNANPEATIFYDNDFHVIEANRRFSELFGYSLDEIQGKDIVDILVPESAKKETETIRQRIKSGQIEIVTTRKRKDGYEIPLLLTGSPVFLGDKAIGSIFVFKDIADIITVQEELNKALSNAQMLNEKLKIVGSLTRHDVRNKLSVITGYSHILRKKYADKNDVVEGLCKMEQSVKDSMKIFDFARVYEQIGVEELFDVDAGRSMDEAKDMFSGLPFAVVNDCRGLTVSADSLFRQLIYNFIDNTRKYGKKTTFARLHCQKTPQGILQLIYEDDGAGIPLENKEHLFKQGFSTGGSTGFGLFLTKKIMEGYGWKIAEEGKTGEGAKFVITIPPENFHLNKT